MRSAKMHWPYFIVILIALNAAGFLGFKLWYGGAGIRPLVKAWPFFVLMNGSALIALYLEVRPKSGAISFEGRSEDVGLESGESD